MNNERFSRLRQLSIFKNTDGIEGLCNKKVAIVGLGATGSTALDLLVRFGFKDFILIDADIVELSNIPRQIYNELDIGKPKVICAKNHVLDINAEAKVRTHFITLTGKNVDNLLKGADIIIDGTDNINTRFIINEYAIKNNVPWIYQGALGSSGNVMPILPKKTACFDCLFPDGRPQETTLTCATMGVSPSIVRIVSAVAVHYAVLISIGHDIKSGIYSIDLNHNVQIDFTEITRYTECSICSHDNYPLLGKDATGYIRMICRNEYEVVMGDNAPSLSTIKSLAKNVGIVLEDKSDFIVVGIRNMEFKFLSSAKATVKVTGDTYQDKDPLSAIKAILREGFNIVVK